ncbi:MAG: N-acetyl-gamma-glutamyl-phosphate reductase [Sulfurimonas sp.]
MLLKSINVGIIGVSGYTGLELVKMVLKHPIFNLNYVANSEGGTTLSSLHPSLKSVSDIEVKKADVLECTLHCELVFLALPHKAAMEFVKPLIAKGLKVVDLSADYRLPLEVYEKHYTKHTDELNLTHAIYGLPELFMSELKSAKLVANPGCFPTSSILAILPFLNYIKKDSPIIIDAKTGVSGAGKKLSETTHFVNVHENLFAYNPLSHRHAPEIAHKLGIDLSRISFVPHLCPVTRGMLSSIYLQVDGSFDELEVLGEFYKDARFVRVLKEPVDMKSVAGTNFCDIFVKRNGNVLFISSAIDNLMRGASSAALVNANIMLGLDESLGVPDIAYVP